jgi:AraC family transcriptional regulator
MLSTHRHVFGEVLRTVQAAEFTLSETAYGPKVKLPKHSHQSAYFCLVLQGGYTETYGSHSRTCEPSSLVFHPENETHSDEFHETGGRCLNVEIEPRWLERIKEHSRILDDSRHFRGGLLTALGARLYHEFREFDETSPLAIEGLALQIVAEATRRTRAFYPRRPGWLNETREIIHDRFSERLTLGEIAQLVKVHPVHLARAFREHYGCTIGDYIRRLRVEFACRQLTNSSTPLCQIALASGFAHQSHFSRIFKNHTGSSPARYRALNSRC